MYAANSDLPGSVKQAIPGEHGRTMFRLVFNSQRRDGKSETVSFASAWAALKRAGYDKDDSGKWTKSDIAKAQYGGREVALDKPFRLPSGGAKKFGVYVKNGERVKRVTFGDPGMEIRRDDPEARANFRARHNCDAKKDKTSPGYWSCRMWEGGATVSELTKEESEIEKRYMNDDAFTLQGEAEARSHDLGFGGAIHVHETADGQKVFMPGPNHEAYLGKPDEPEEPEDEEHEGAGIIERTAAAVMRAAIEADKESASVLKVDMEQRIVWGWASVISEGGAPIVDKQGDVISAVEMTKCANRFMESARLAKAMHAGGGIGEVIHSLPLTVELAKALGLSSEREGWIIAVKVHGDGVWEKVKAGDYRAFSIGGKARREEIHE